MAIKTGVYHPRNPESSSLWLLFNNHFESFVQCYEERFERKYGYLRNVIRNVVEKYLRCGDLKEGFARVKCEDCHHEFLLAFSCQGRWLCPSCQAKKVIMFGDHLENNVLYPVPHRQYVFSLPILLRGYFKYDRKLLSKLCRCAYDSLLLFLRTQINLENGIPGVAMVIHTFGNNPTKFHPHAHLISTDGLFADTGTFYVMRDVDLKPLEEIFRAQILKMLKKEGKIDQSMISKLLKWKHSGFGIDNGIRIEKNNAKGREAIAQYIARNTINQEKIRYQLDTGRVIYHYKMSKGKNKKNFGVYDAEAFIAALTQHIPDRSFQMLRYYGFYSNKSRGLREKERKRMKKESISDDTGAIELIDISKHCPKKIPSLTWRNCIKKIYEIDPLECPRCGGEMRIISFIHQFSVIRKILEHLELWGEDHSRGPPQNDEFIYEPIDDGWFREIVDETTTIIGF